MDLSDLTRTLEGRGVRLYASGGRLRIVGRRDALTPDLQRITAHHARALLYRLTLYRHLHRGDRVQTPDGPGRVLQVFAHRVAVHLDGRDRADDFEPEAVELLPTEGPVNTPSREAA